MIDAEDFKTYRKNETLAELISTLRKLEQELHK